jgi:KaiC/GvpD/RAD55 family RecA-like ATPase
VNDIITASLDEEDVHLLFNFPTELLSSGEAKMVDWISRYTSKFGKPPTLIRFTKQFANFLPIRSGNPLGDIYEQTLQRKRNLYAREYLMQIQDELKKGEDPLPYIERLHETIRSGGSDVVRYSRFDRSAYYRRPSTIPYDIDPIDQYTGGISKGDLIYLIGRLGTGKTTFALWVVYKWLQQNRKVLMVSNENRAEDVIAKIDSYVAGFNPAKKRTREWTDEDIDKLSTVTYIANNMEGEVFIPNKPVGDIKELQGYIYAYKPDIVVVDGIYLMRGMKGESHWEKITNVSRSLKEIAEGEGIPLLGIHQANRQAIGRHIEIEHVAYSDALAQDADLMLAINAEKDGSVFIEPIKNRWGSENWGLTLRFYFNTMKVKIITSAPAKVVNP